VPPPPADEKELRELRLAVGSRSVVAAASTHPGEEEACIDAHARLRARFPNLLSIVVPRHPERGADVASIAHVSGLKASLRSRGELPLATTDIYVADTLGELGLVYRLAPIVFMGGSLASHGGQNPIEAAKLGAAILHGPHVWNFTEIYQALDDARGAEEVLDVSRLTVRMGAWLTDAALRKQVADSGLATVDKLGGALRRTLAAIEPYLMQLDLERR
jgi:3-deoxy-D-manno-octulosonic-acid transferase